MYHKKEYTLVGFSSFSVGEQNSRPAVEHAPGSLSALPARKNYRAAMNKKTIQLSPTSKE